MDNKLDKKTWDQINEAVEGEVIADPDNHQRTSDAEPEAEPSMAEEYVKDEIMDHENITLPMQKMLLVLDTEVDFFKVDNENVYASIKSDSGITHHKINSRRFNDFLGGLCVSNKINPTKDLLGTLVSTVKYKILNGSTPIEAINFRKGIDSNGNVWILQSIDPKVRYVKITKDGWSIENECPIKIKLGNRSASLPDPVISGKGDFNLLKQYINIPENEIPLFESWLIETNTGVLEYPIIHLNGEAGTGKSTLIDIIHCLIDPIIQPDGSTGGSKRGMIKDVWSMYVGATNTHILTMDNISKTPDWFDDILCQLATGGDFEARQHHTMDESLVLSSHNPIIIGSINQVSTATDVQRRSIYIHTQYLGTSKSKSKLELWDSFMKDLPTIYSGYLDLIAKVLKKRHKADSTDLVSMTDFIITGRTLGQFRDWNISFDDSMKISESIASDNILESNPLAQLLIHTLKESGKNELSMLTSEWSLKLFDNTESMDGDDNTKSYLRSLFTKSQQRRLGENFTPLKPLLRNQGYEFNKKRTNKGSNWTLNKIDESVVTVVTDATSGDNSSPSKSDMSDIGGITSGYDKYNPYNFPSTPDSEENNNG